MRVWSSAGGMRCGAVRGVAGGWVREHLRQRAMQPEGEDLSPKKQLAVLWTMVPEKEFREFISTSYEALKTHLLSLIHDRTQGPAPMSLSNLTIQDVSDVPEWEGTDPDFGKVELCRLEVVNGRRQVSADRRARN